MIKRLPIIPTIVVVAAAALMVWLGVWQLQRAKLHKAQLASFVAASRKPPIVFPTIPIRNYDTLLYRYATGNCLRVAGRRTSAGENRSGEPGFVIILDCATGAEGPGMSVQVGWSKNPNAATPWKGGLVSGVVVQDDQSRFRLVADAPAPGLEPSALPIPTVKISPERNRIYAGIWFAFAAIALIIYGLAVRKRLTEAKPAR